MGKSPALMGVINLTPDSFWKGSRIPSSGAPSRALEMVEEGAVFIDVGAESTRPGAAPLDHQTEWNRLAEPLGEIIKALEGGDAKVSVDTYHASTAQKAMAMGADLINDPSGLLGDGEMLMTCAPLGFPFLVNHAVWPPATMMENPLESSLVVETVSKELALKRSLLIRFGIKPSDVLVDPGIGFGKKQSANITLLENLESIKEACQGARLVVGVSRKSLIGHLTNGAVEERLR
ncbi:dihydropteroate synthase, partial [bacterium]|nr:dihydropteroate synthase [bacterium]